MGKLKYVRTAMFAPFFFVVSEFVWPSSSMLGMFYGMAASYVLCLFLFNVVLQERIDA